MATSNRLAFVAVFALLAIYACHSWFGPDIFYHLSWGRDLITHSSFMPRPRTLIAQPLPANVYWIFQGAMYLVDSGLGLYGVSAVFALTWLLIFTLWINLSGNWRRDFGPALTLVFLVLAQLRFEERPEIFSYFFILLFICILKRLEKSHGPVLELAALFVLESLWTGLHGYFALGPLMIVVFAAANFKRWRLSPTAVFVVIAGSLANPFGPAAWEMVVAYSRLGTRLQDLNQELFRPSLWPPSWPLSLFWLAWGATLIRCIRAIRPVETRLAGGLALLGLALSLTAVRNLPLLPLFGVLIWNPRVSLPALPRWALQASVISAALTLAIVFVRPARAPGDLSTFGVHLDWTSYPIGVSAFLKQNLFKGAVFADSYDGGYLEFENPDIRVTGDSYFSDAEITRGYFAAIKDPSAFYQLLERTRLDALVLNVENFRVVDAILNDPRWHLVYGDSHRALFYPAGVAKTLDPARIEFWHGEDLTNDNVAFGPTLWGAIAAHRGWHNVAFKIARDLSGSRCVPVSVTKPLLQFAKGTDDQALQNQLGQLNSSCR